MASFTLEEGQYPGTYLVFLLEQEKQLGADLFMLPSAIYSPDGVKTIATSRVNSKSTVFDPPLIYFPSMNPSIK